MTDKEVLCSYRLKEAEETLADAEKMLKEGFSPRSIVNRAYYSAFYATLALFLHANIDALVKSLFLSRKGAKAAKKSF